MDTKLKSSKKVSLVTAGILVILATAVFMAAYPVFEKRAAEFEGDIFQTDTVQEELYLANFILYRDLQELVQGKELPYHELLLKVSAKECEEEDMGLLEDFDVVNLEGQGFTALAKREFDAFLGSYEEMLRENLLQQIDYRMVDHATGKSVKNTKYDLEKLGTDEASEELAEKYVAYVRMYYDDAGFLKDVAVKGKKPDDLLKKVQSTMNGSLLEKGLWGILQAYGLRETGNKVYFQSSAYGKYYEAETKQEKGPKGVTVCYAMTQEQLDQFENYQGWNRWYAYYQAGTADMFRIILAVLFLFAFFLPLWKRYALHKSAGVRLHLEFSLIVGMFFMSFVPEMIIYLVNSTNKGHFDEFYRKYILFMPKEGYFLLTGMINAAILVFLFGVWFYLVTSLGEVFSLGVKRFICERSLIVKLCGGGKRLVKGSVNKLKEETLHTDLGKETNHTVLKLVAVNYLILALFCLMWTFGWLLLLIYSVVLYFVIKKYVQKVRQQYDRVLEAAKSIADGDLNTALDRDFGIFESCREELARVQDGLKKAVEEEVKSQRMKTELITNVSHDLKTPLTAITTYIELLEDETLSPEQRKEYLEVLKKKSARLKFLIEDLFEVSKANSGNVTLNPVDVDICNLIRQVYLEYEDKIEEAELIFRFTLPKEKVVLKLDSQKTYRIFENLYVNAIKYAMPHTRVYIRGEKTEKGFLFEMKNMSACELNIAPQELTERFVRGDSSRNTEGSGLGLAIAKSFTELQGGKLQVDIDGDLFKVSIEW